MKVKVKKHELKELLETYRLRLAHAQNEIEELKEQVGRLQRDIERLKDPEYQRQQVKKREELLHYAPMHRRGEG